MLINRNYFRAVGVRARALICLLCIFFSCFAGAAPSRDAVLDTMKNATRFMVETVSYRGGYVWHYLPDLSRQWGELEAYRSMIWLQPPGTATMGHVFLDAYHATGDDYYYQAAEQVAGAIVWAQHPSGGWNYVADFAGEASLKHWYATVGKNAWRLEEFHHYYGNATFDDGGTAEASKFLLRLYLEKLDPKYRPALDKSIDFVLNAQYPIGGWPQRFPLRHDYPRKDQPDYTSFITFNDDVAEENIEFLLMCYQALGEQRVREPIIRAMNAFLVTQQGQPQPGWALQYTPELQPAGARSYEPLSLSPQTTGNNIRQLIKFYRMTGETKFLARIPEALAWLDRVRLPAAQIRDGRTHPTFVELGTGRPLYTHRRGSNVVNGEYYVDYTPGNELMHYRSVRFVDVEGLKHDYQQVLQLKPEEVTAGSPLKTTRLVALPRYFTLEDDSSPDADSVGDGAALVGTVQQLIAGLNTQGYWPTPLRNQTHAYQGPGPATPPRRPVGTLVGDAWDTSPYPVDNPPLGISTRTYVKNMGQLIRYLLQES